MEKNIPALFIMAIGYVRVGYLKFIQIRSFTTQQLKFASVCGSIMENWGPLIESQ